MSLWTEHFGILYETFKEPERLKCVLKVNAIAYNNQRIFASEDLSLLKEEIQVVYAEDDVFLKKIESIMLNEMEIASGRNDVFLKLMLFYKIKAQKFDENEDSLRRNGHRISSINLLLPIM